MGTAACKDRCKDEPVKHCNITLYLLGFRSCFVCGKAYVPSKEKGCKQDDNGGWRCYCCANLMRTKPKNKEVWNKMVKVVYH